MSVTPLRRETRTSTKYLQLHVAILIATTTLVGLGMYNDLQAFDALAMGVCVASCLAVVPRLIRTPSTSLFLLGIVVAGGVFFAARGAVGVHDLDNAPQSYPLTMAAYSDAVRLGSFGVLAALVVYLFAFRDPQPRAPQRRQPPSRGLHQYIDDVPVRLFMVLGVTTFVVRLGLQTLGVGVKGQAAAVPFQGYLLVGTTSMSVLLVASLWLSALVSGVSRRTAVAFGFIVVHALVGAYGGNRGSIFSALIIMAFGFALTRTVRFGPRLLLRIGQLAGLVLVGTIVAIEFRLAVTGGRDFAPLEFLSLRTAGPHAFGPVVQSEVQVGWVQALTDNTIVRDEVHGLVDKTQLGVGSSWFGFSYLAQGTTGVVAIGMILGLVAAGADRLFSRLSGLIALSLYVAVAQTFAKSIGGAFVSQIPNELAGLAAVLGLLLVLGRATPRQVSSRDREYKLIAPRTN